MEQLKTNWFWIVCGVLSLAMVGMFFYGSSSVYTLQSANESAITKSITDIEAVKKTTATLEGAALTIDPVHPNTASMEEMKKEIDKTIDAVVVAWEARRKAQENILKWPEEVLRDAETARKLSKYDPPQKFPVADAQNNKPTIDSVSLQPLLLIYQTQIPKRMDKIASIIKTHWKYQEKVDLPPASTDSAEGKPSIASVSEPELKTVVSWTDENQKLWNDKLTSFKGRDGNLTEQPLPRQVFALQEDLWLLEACFNVIKNVNGDAETNQMAAIKEIVHVAFGKEAYVQKMGEIREPTKELLSGSLIVGEAETPTAKIKSQEDLLASSAETAAEGRRETAGFDFKLEGENDKYLAPFHGRYVDTNFRPIKIQDLQTAMNSPTLVDNNLETIVARRIPFRIAVKMTETKIPDLIAAFSNSEFAFEVYQVRINRNDAYEKIEMKGANAAASKDKRDKPSAGGAGAGGNAAKDDAGGATTGPGSGDAETSTVAKYNNEARRNYDVDVEFYGIVKIYNPVDREKLKKHLEQAAPPAAAQNASPQNPKT